jgi:hypothetical protein
LSLGRLAVLFAIPIAYPALADSQTINLAGQLGILTLADSGPDIGHDSLRLYNVDGTLWYLFSFYYDDSDGRWDFPNNDFEPLAFSPDNFVLALAVTHRDSLGYEVIVNHETGLRKWLPAAPYLQFQTWEQHLLTVFAVGLDSTANPVYTAANAHSRRIRYPGRSTTYWPLEVRGDWLRVGWDGDRPGKRSGWIRWRRENLLIVELFYLD